MGTINRKPVASNAGIYLKTDPGNGFLPADRVAGNAGNYRMVGPVLAGGAADRSFMRARVPLRGGTTDAGSPHVGVTAVLLVVDTATNLVVARREATVTQGATELVFSPLPVLPAGANYAYPVGVPGGTWDSHTALFYGAETGYASPNAATPSLYSDTDPVAAGATYSAPTAVTRHRTVLLDANGTVKNVRGPLDASDFPVVTSLDQLLAGQVALLDNGTDPPRLVRKRLDGSAPMLANAVAEWPVFVGQYSGAGQSIGKAFTRLQLSSITDTHGGFDPATSVYTAPQNGLYRIEMKVRYDDSTSAGINIGVGAGRYAQDEPAFLWNCSVAARTNSAQRNGLINQRLLRLNAGDQVQLYTYCDWDPMQLVIAAEMTIDRIR